MSFFSNTMYQVQSTLITNYLTLEGPSSTWYLSFSGGSNIEFCNSDPSVSSNWSSASSATSYAVPNSKCYLRGKTGSTPIYSINGMSGTTQVLTKVSGDLRTLIDYDNPDSVTISADQFHYYLALGTGLHSGLFGANDSTYGVINTALTDISGLTIPNLNDGATDAYHSMFMGCTALTGTVYLPDTPLIGGGTTSACTDMFTDTQPKTTSGTKGTMYTANPTEWTSSTASTGIDTDEWNVVTATTSASVPADSAASL